MKSAVMAAIIAAIVATAVLAAKKKAEEQARAQAAQSQQEAADRQVIAERAKALNEKQAALKKEISAAEEQVIACQGEEAQMTGKNPPPLAKAAMSDTNAMMNHLETLKNEANSCRKRIAAAKAAKELAGINAQVLAFGGILKGLEAKTNSCYEKRGLATRVNYSMPVPGKSVEEAKRSLAGAIAAMGAAQAKAQTCEKQAQAASSQESRGVR